MAITPRVDLETRYKKVFNTRSGVVGTQFTKNQFGKDISGMEGGPGSSGQPFIKRFPIPGAEDRPSGEYFDISTQALSLDFPIRGGSYEELASREDFARIDRFLLYYPQGRAFTDKQKFLLRSNPILETGYTGGVENTRLYPIREGRFGLGSSNLMEQIASTGTGFHIPNAGGNIDDLLNPFNVYNYIVPHKDKLENRLVSLYNLKVRPGGPEPGFNERNETVIRLGLTPKQDTRTLSITPGGPDSLYGVGFTDIKKSTDFLGSPINTGEAPFFIGPTSTDIKGFTVQGTDLGKNTLDYNNFIISDKFKIPGLDNNIQGINLSNLDQQNSADYIRAVEIPASLNGFSERQNFSYTMGYDALLKGANNGELTSTVNFTDFRNGVNNESILSSDYANDSMVTRINIGSPGARINNRDDIDRVNIIAQDKLNLVDNYIDDNDQITFNEDKSDLIKFSFHTIDNSNPDRNINTHFRALLTGYSDSFTPEWNAVKYAGRGENFYTYQGFDRDVSFNFKIAAQTKSEMAVLYRKVNYLLSTVYPDYDNDSGFMRGNLTRLTVGDLFNRTPGILQSLNVTVNDDYPWEVALNDRTMLQTPHILDIAVSWTPILQDLPRSGYTVDNRELIQSQVFLDDKNYQYFRPQLGGAVDSVITSRGYESIPSSPITADTNIPQRGPQVPKFGEKGYKKYLRQTYRDLKNQGVDIKRSAVNQTIREQRKEARENRREERRRNREERRENRGS